MKTLTSYCIMMWYDHTEDGKVVPHTGSRDNSGAVYVLAKSFELAKFTTDYTAIPWVDMLYTIDTQDAGDLGGWLGARMDQFDPRLN